MSYASIEFADNYFSGQYKSKWSTLDNATKQTLLDNATFNIDTLAYKGKKVDANQTNEFPRKFCDRTLSDDNRVARACCEEAISIYDNDGINPNTIASDGGGFKIGDIQVDDATTSNQNSGYSALFSAKALDLLKPYLKSSTFKVVL